MTQRRRDYAYEALAEVTASDPEIARGELNAALRDIRKMEPEVASVEDSYLLGDLVHARAKMYRAVFSDAALTPTALSKHWLRVLEEFNQMKRGGTNLHVEVRGPVWPPSNREKNLEQARRVLAMLNGEEI